MTPAPTSAAGVGNALPASLLPDRLAARSWAARQADAATPSQPAWEDGEELWEACPR